jgi:nucleoside-diphosphate-sugar epimerase
MNILLTGGSGDLGMLLAYQLLQAGHHPVNLDVRPPLVEWGRFIQGSVTDPEILAHSLNGIDQVVHIAAWHGIHEFRKEKDVFDFWELNVTGTFLLFEYAARAGIDQLIYISSTSVDEWPGVYGHTKIMGEEIARTYAARHGMSVLILRPRAFIPPWNTFAYQDYTEWARWFQKGAVHIDDVVQAAVLSLGLLTQRSLPEPPILTLDSGYEFSEYDLAHWDELVPVTTFATTYPEHLGLLEKYGLDPAVKPSRLDISAAQSLLRYQPRYSMRNLLSELQAFGREGPPRPPALTA